MKYRERLNWEPNQVLCTHLFISLDHYSMKAGLNQPSIHYNNSQASLRATLVAYNDPRER